MFLLILFIIIQLVRKFIYINDELGSRVQITKKKRSFNLMLAIFPLVYETWYLGYQDKRALKLLSNISPFPAPVFKRPEVVPKNFAVLCYSGMLFHHGYKEKPGTVREPFIK